MNIIKKFFSLWVLCLLSAACGVVISPGDDAGEDQFPVTPDDGATESDAAQVDAARASDASTPPAVDGPAACLGCFLGAACVPSTPMQCGSNSACVRCPAPRVPDCQEATCESGACAIRNRPDGTGCTGGVCVAGACQMCGTNDTACCTAGNRCNPGLTCVAEVGSSFQYCTPCGALDGACCGGPRVGTITRVGTARIVRNPGGSCGTTLTCNAGGACSCGLLGELCCPGSMCREGRCRHDGTCGV